MGEFVSSLGEEINSVEFSSLIFDIEEVPVICLSPEESDDPIDKTVFYKFFGSGVEVGLRRGKLDHMHFFIRPDEGYNAYMGPMPTSIEKNDTEASVIKTFGLSSQAGGGKQSQLLGFVYRWIKYDQGPFSMRCEFAQDGLLRKMSLILA